MEPGFNYKKVDQPTSFWGFFPDSASRIFIFPKTNMKNPMTANAIPPVKKPASEINFPRVNSIPPSQNNKNPSNGIHLKHFNFINFIPP